MVFEVGFMHQDDINKDLKHYIHEKKDKPFWKGMFKKGQHEEHVRQELKEDVERMGQQQEDNMAPEDKKALENMEEDIKEANMEEQEIDNKREGVLKKFFKKLNFSKGSHDSRDENEDDLEDEGEQKDTDASGTTDDEMKDFLKMVHSYITRLPSEDLQDFKKSKDFELYTKVLEKYGLIKK
jgi:hypothetical protein